MPNRLPATADPSGPIELTGRDFAGLTLATTAQVGRVSISARSLWRWTEQPAPGPKTGTTIGAPVQRAVLAGDVEIVFGLQRFTAARAVTWIEDLGPSKRDPKVHAFQVAAYFDRVSDATAEAGTAQSGDRLLVTAIVQGPASMGADLIREGRPTNEHVVFTAEAEQRLATFLQEQLGEGEVTAEPSEERFDGGIMGGGRTTTGLIIPGLSQPFEPNSPYSNPDRPRSAGSVLDATSGARSEPLFSSRGVITISAGEPTFIAGADAGGTAAQNSIVITGGAIVQYLDGRRDRALQLSCQRAVVFLTDGSLKNLLAAPADKVEGIYLEGDVVATDGQYTLRGQQIYYDIKRNKAMIVDAVFWSYDQKKDLPIYVRASTLRQLATNQFSGEDVRISTSSFFQPHLAMGAGQVTITREVPPGQIARTILRGTDITGRFMDMPFFYYPSFSGDDTMLPLRDVRFENSSRTGFGVKTKWDLFGLLGVEAGPEWDFQVLIDGWSERNVGLGADLKWTTENAKGSIFAYTVPFDSGSDVLSSGKEVDREGYFRGIFLGDNRWQISEHWSAFMELAAVSDANFVQSYFEELARTRREFTSSAYVRRLEGNTALTAQLRGNVNTFSSNQYILQSQGYDVAKLPELTYTRVSDDLLAGLAPGLLTYSSEYRLSRMALNFTEKSPDALGFDRSDLSQDAFGISTPTTRVSTFLESQGLSENFVSRFDTRHEVSGVVDAGPVRLNPFLVGRFTAYDTKFESFSGDPDDSRYRAWGAIGARASTSVTRVYDDVESSLFDIHRLRHVVEPSTTVWMAGTNRGQSTLPVYDTNVESITQGGAVRAGVSQTLQTQRGGEGRWQTVDVLKLDTNIIYAANNADRESPIGRFIDYRPEYSTLGKFVTVDATYQATDALAMTFHETYDYDKNQQARTSGGLVWQQWRDTTLYTDVHFLNDRNATYVSSGADFRLTPKYVFGVGTTYDVQDNRFQSVRAKIEREFEQAIFGVRIGYNDITDEFSLGIDVIPTGFDPRLRQLQRLNRDALDAGFTDSADSGLRGRFSGPLSGDEGSTGGAGSSFGNYGVPGDTSTSGGRRP